MSETSHFTGTPAHLDGLKTALGTGLRAEGAAFEKIVAWLASLRLLYGVPFWYLVPDGRMLPSESIKFFEVNQNWIDCLIDGAFSIGRSTTGDAQRERAVMDEVMARVAARARELRDEKFGVKGPVEQDRASGYACTGFLLRSGVVAGWPGLTVRAKANGVHARKVRFEAVAPNILFCLFDRQVDTVVFAEPVEILHFGLDEPEPPSTDYTKTLRYIDSGSPSIPPGTQMSGPGTQIPVPLSPQRVVDVSALATSIQSALIDTGGMPAEANYTPAEFALELVEGVQQVTFKLAGAAGGATA